MTKKLCENYLYLYSIDRFSDQLQKNENFELTSLLTLAEKETQSKLNRNSIETQFGDRKKVGGIIITKGVLRRNSFVTVKTAPFNSIILYKFI